MTTHSGERLDGQMSTVKVVALVIAAAAPMGAVLGVLPLAFALGSGASLPAVFLLVGLVLLCFAVGYAAISQRIASAGGFYTYVARGLGRPPALAAAILAMIAYIALTLQLAAGIGYFGNLVTTILGGPDIPWWIFSAVGIAFVGILGRKEINLAGSALLVLLSAEILVLLILDVAIIWHKGAAAFPLTAVNPGKMFSAGNFGLGLMFAFSTYLGFESAAIYAEETKDPKRSIPRATYAAVLIITAFYAFTSWITVGGVGADKIQATAGEQLGNLYLGLSDTYASSVVTKVMLVTLLSSLLACMLALHNAASRYLFSVGRERAILPGWLGVPHPRFESPARASTVVTTICAVVTIGFAVTHANPYLKMATMATGLGTLGILTLQGLASAAIIAYFRRDSRRLAAVVGSVIGLVGFTFAVVMVIKNFTLLVDNNSAIVAAVPYLVIAVAIVGGVYGFVLRSRGAPAYNVIGSFGETPEGTADETMSIESAFSDEV